MPDHKADDRILLSPIISKKSGKRTTSPALSDLSEKDRVWDTHRFESDQIESHYKGTEFNRYADRIHFCTEFLEFSLRPADSGELKLKLASARFCHVRTCMVCSWRKSLMYKARTYKALPKFLIDYPRYRFLFLTLTVKNCEISDLRQTIDWMNQSFTRLSRLKDFPGEGWVKSVEVTKGKRGDAHPHFHCLLAVKSSYFGRDYLSQQKWCDLWQKSLRVDYQPILDVQALKPTGSLVALIAEVVKYQTKATHLIGDGSVQDKEWFLEYTRQIANTKAISIGGILKDYFRELEEEPQDLIGHDDTEVSEEMGRLTFNWKRGEAKYRLVE
jgi:plasmid rolling circle replication initiator protein Rep